MWKLVIQIKGRTQIWGGGGWEWGAEENIICALHQQLLGDQITDDEMRGAHSMYGRDKKCILYLSLLRELEIDQRIIVNGP
jgi:hypothetical protein